MSEPIPGFVLDDSWAGGAYIRLEGQTVSLGEMMRQAGYPWSVIETARAARHPRVENPEGSPTSREEERT